MRTPRHVVVVGKTGHISLSQTPYLCLFQPLKLGHHTNKDTFKGVWFREVSL